MADLEAGPEPKPRARHGDRRPLAVVAQVNRVRRRKQVHLLHRGGLNRKGRKRMRGRPDFSEMDAARRMELDALRAAIDNPVVFQGVEPPVRQIRLPPGELERIRARVDAHIAEMVSVHGVRK